MKNHEIEAALSQAKGRYFIHKGQKQKLIRYDIKDNIIKLVTDLHDIVVMQVDFQETFAQFEFLEMGLQTKAAIEQTIISGSAQDMKNILLDNIKKVQLNKDYIPQAVEVKANIDSIISLAKTEIEMMKTVRSLGQAKPD